MKRILFLLILSAVSLGSIAQTSSFVNIVPNTFELQRRDGKLYFFQAVKIDSVFCGALTNIPIVCDGRTVYQKTVEILPDPNREVSDAVYLYAYMNKESSQVISSGKAKNYEYQKKDLGTILNWEVTQKNLLYKKGLGMVIEESVEPKSGPAFTIWALLFFMIISIWRVFDPKDYAYSFKENEAIVTGALWKSVIVAISYSILRVFDFDGSRLPDPPQNWWILPILFIVPIVYRLTIYNCQYKKNWKKVFAEYKNYEVIKHIVPVVSFVSWAVVYLMIVDNLELTKLILFVSLGVTVLFFILRYLYEIEKGVIFIFKKLPLKKASSK